MVAEKPYPVVGAQIPRRRETREYAPEQSQRERALRERNLPLMGARNLKAVLP